MEFVQPQPFDEAIVKLGSRSQVVAALNSEQWRDVPTALRDRAFFSANVESVRFLDRAQSTLSDYLSGARDNSTGALRAGSRAAFVEQLQRFAISEGMGPLKPSEKGTIKDITSEGRLALIFDTQTKAARDYGNWKQGMDPAVLDEFPAQRFFRQRRVKKPRSYHKAALNEVRLKTDISFWLNLNRDFGVPWGPWGFNSGCEVEDVDRAAAQKLRLLKPNEPVHPVEKDFNEGLAASVRGLSDGLVGALISKFGDQVELVGDQVVWKGHAPIPATAPIQPSAPDGTPPRQEPAAPETAPDRAAGLRSVQQVFQVQLGGELGRQADLALNAVDDVHLVPNLRQVPIDDQSGSDTTFGVYTAGDKGEYRIGLMSNGPWPALTALHEIGHDLDQLALGKNTIQDATRDLIPGALLTPWYHAVSQTSAVQALRANLAAGTNDAEREYAQYLLRPDELWARAYAQYIAEKSANPELLKQLALSYSYEPGRQWDSGEFVPVATAMDDLFASLGWLR